MISQLQDLPNFAGKRITGIGLRKQLHAKVQASAMNDGVLGITGGVQHGDSRKPLSRPTSQFRTFQIAGHHDVSEEKVYRVTILDNAERFNKPFLLHCKPGSRVRQHLDCRWPDFVVILCDENGLRAAEDGSLDLRKTYMGSSF